MVPFIDLRRFEEGFLDAWNEKIQHLSANATFIGGQEVQQLEADLSTYVGVSHAVSCANGTDALQLALRAMGVGEGDVVLIPDMTFWATFEAVVNVGAKVVTVDVSLEDGGIDIDALQQAIAAYEPKAAIVAHLFGWASARLNDIRSLCAAHGVLLLEDGAQCFGVKHEGHSIYQGALIATTSFYPAKVFGAAGDGGAVFTNDDALATKVRQLSNHGRTSHYGHGLVGWNSRLDSFQAAFLNLSLPNLDAKIASRQASASVYRSSLNHPKVIQIFAPENFEENGYCNVCLVRDKSFKAALESHLKANGIGFANIYPSPMSKQPAAAEFLVGHVGGDNAVEWCASVLNLPLFPYMNDAELQRVISLVNKFEG